MKNEWLIVGVVGVLVYLAYKALSKEPAVFVPGGGDFGGHGATGSWDNPDNVPFTSAGSFVGSGLTVPLL